MQILKESIEANGNPTPPGHMYNNRKDHEKSKESPNPEVAAAPLQPAIPIEQTGILEANANQDFYMEDTEVRVEVDSINESAIERLRQLLNNSGQKGAKIKFTVDMEEKEKNGRLGLRIVAWEVKNPLLASPINTKPPHRDTDSLETPVLGGGTPRTQGNGYSDGVRENITPPLADSIISDHEEEEQSKLNLSIGGEMPSFNE